MSCSPYMFWCSKRPGWSSKCLTMCAYISTCVVHKALRTTTGTWSIVDVPVAHAGGVRMCQVGRLVGVCQVTALTTMMSDEHSWRCMSEWKQLTNCAVFSDRLTKCAAAHSHSVCVHACAFGARQVCAHSPCSLPVTVTCMLAHARVNFK
jgi:hypothetical protein